MPVYSWNGCQASAHAHPGPARPVPRSQSWTLSQSGTVFSAAWNPNTSSLGLPYLAWAQVNTAFLHEVNMKSVLASVRKHLESKYWLHRISVSTLCQYLTGTLCMLFTAIVIFSMLTMITTFLVFTVIILKLSISQIRIVTIVLGSITISSVFICLMAGYIRSHSHRQLTFPKSAEQPLQMTEQKCHEKSFCQKAFDSLAAVEAKNNNPSMWSSPSSFIELRWPPLAASLSVWCQCCQFFKPLYIFSVSLSSDGHKCLWDLVKCNWLFYVNALYEPLLSAVAK